MILRICFSLHKDIEINFNPRAKRQEVFKDVLSFFCVHIDKYDFHLLLNIVYIGVGRFRILGAKV